MEKEVAKLKREIRRAPRNERGRRRYGRELRERVIELAKRWRADGRAVTTLARQLGIRDSMLSEWLRKSGAKRVRPVEVTTEPSAPATTLRVRLPSGAVIEGLSLENVATLLRTPA